MQIKACKQCKKPYIGKGTLFCTRKCQKQHQSKRVNEQCRNDRASLRQSKYGRSYRYIKDYAAIDSGYF